MTGFSVLKSGICLLVIAALIPCLSACRSEQHRRPAEELIRTGWDAFRLGDFDQATRSFEEARLAAKPASDEYRSALFALATTWNLRRPGEDREKATILYQELISSAPDSDLAAWSSLALARMQHLMPVGTEPDYGQVREAYHNVIQACPDHPAAEEATIYLYSTYVATMNPDDCRKVLVDLQRFVDTHPDSGFLSAAYGLMSECYKTLKEPEKEFQAKLQAFNTREVDVTNPFYDNSWRYWNIAASAEFEAGDFDTARKYYTLLIQEYPQDIRVFSAKQAIERMEHIEETMRKEIEAGR